MRQCLLILATCGLLAAAAAAQPASAWSDFIVDTYERLGRRERALDWLERACDTDLSLAKIEFYPGLRELRTHDRYRDIVARRGG